MFDTELALDTLSQIKDTLSMIKYHACVNIKIMMDNDISHPFNILPVYSRIFKK